ncbi:MAG TPA: CsgG/HfaB family protein [Steroidobacteraceae bacterium]|nr:CsgG/HfaB family protein [Steroidobacteraceae bacterium]
MRKSCSHVSYIAFLLAAGGALTTAVAHAEDAAPQIPTCDKKIGTLAVAEPQNQWWTALNLESPAALIKVFVSQSKCFTLVDRGKGLQAAQAERALSASGEERAGSNIGKGQMKAADYVLVPDIANQNRNSGGTKIGGVLGGLLPHGIGAVVGGISLKSKTADVVLTLTDVRSTEQVALEQGHSKKTDLGWGAGGGGAFFGGFAAGGASSYANTEIGQVVSMAYLDAYIKMVGDLKNAAPDAKADNVQQAVKMAKPGKMYTESNLKSKLVRDLDPGMMLYPTGDKMGVWWKVTDELGNEGWVVSTNFSLAH